MPRRSARIIDPQISTRMIDTMHEWRTAATTLCDQAKICGPEYEAATALMRRIDDMAGTLTGNREFFWGRSTAPRLGRSVLPAARPRLRVRHREHQTLRTVARCCERHSRGVCFSKFSLESGTAENHLIEGGLPTDALVAQVIVSRYADNLQLYRQAQNKNLSAQPTAIARPPRMDLTARP